MLTGNPFFAMRILLSVTLLTVLLIPATVSAVESCAIPEIGVYSQSRLRAGLRPTNRCTQYQTRYLRGLYGDAQRAYSAEQQEYTQWLRENMVTPATHTVPTVTTRKTFRLIRGR